MPKGLDDFDLGNACVGSDYAQQKQEAEGFVRWLEEMEEDPTYLWAYDTISGIRTSVQLSGRVTDGQRTAIVNIRQARRSGDRPRYGRSRRYEGWNPSQ